ncbi:MAG: T9SS type A sorting domain-containing protein, partial [Saprospiraceae bacterium]
CVNSLTVYKIDKVPGASSYTWTLPPGWTGASSLDTISAMAGSNSGTISVVANNVCGASAPSTMTVHTTNLPGQPSIISGPDTLCPNSLGLFSVVSANDLSAYSWILPNGWNGSSQTNTITARAGNNGGILTVIASNVCGFSPIRTLTTTVSIKVLPGVIEKITGLDTLCVNSNAIFTAKPSIGATSYTWTLPDGWSGTSSTNSITAIAGSSGNISVIANNQCGSTQPKTFAVTTKSPPPGISFIIGKSTVCKASTNLFNASAVQGASSYTWSLPPGWSGMSTTNFLNAISGNTSGDISVTANNACGSSSPFIFPVATEQINTSISITGITLVSNSIGATYQWLDCFDNSKITGQTSQVYTPAQSGTYAVIISRNGCVDTSACIMLSTVSTTTSLNELGIKIFPNPARSFFSVEMQQNHPATIEIIDALGRKVMIRDLKFPLLRFDVTSLPKGIYFANFKVSNQQVTQKLLIL